MLEYDKEIHKYPPKTNHWQIEDITTNTNKNLSPILEIEFNSEEDKHAFLKKIVIDNIELIKSIKNLSEQDKIFIVTLHPDAIQYIENPSEEVQIAAIKYSHEAYKHINNPSERVQLVALIELWLYIEAQEKSKITSDYDEDYTPPKFNFNKEVQIAAAKENPYVIACIQSPCKEALLIAVQKRREVIEYIDNPNEEIQVIAIKQSHRAIFSIKNPYKKAIQLHNTLRQKDQECNFNEKTIKIPNNDNETYNLLLNMHINDRITFKNKYYIPTLIQSLIDENATISLNRNDTPLKLLWYNEYYYRFTDNKNNFWFLSRNNNNLAFCEVCLQKIEKSQLPNLK